MGLAEGRALQDRVAIVTGAATGIGRASAVLFARAGARVALADVRASARGLQGLFEPQGPADHQGGSAMNGDKQLFSASRAKDAVYKTGLRSFMEYRDLGIDHATHGQFRAHVVRIKQDACGSHDLHTTGLHQHLCDFQMFYVLNGRIKFVHETKAVRQIPETAAAAR